MFTTTTALLVAAILPQAFATVFITSPTATTTCQGGQQCQVSWQEDTGNTAPLLANWGPTNVGIWVGSQQQQTELQLIQDNVNVATTASITFTPDPSIGPNDNIYFIRFTSDVTRDPNNPNAFVESFSAKFTLGNMSGSFNASVAAQIAGTSGTPGAPAPPASSAPSLPSVASNSIPSPASASKPASSAASSTKASQSAKPSSSSAAVPLAGGVRLSGFIAPVAAILALFL